MSRTDAGVDTTTIFVKGGCNLSLKGGHKDFNRFRTSGRILDCCSSVDHLKAEQAASDSSWCIEKLKRVLRHPAKIVPLKR